MRIVPPLVVEREIHGAGAMFEEQLRELSLHSLETLKAMGPPGFAPLSGLIVEARLNRVGQLAFRTERTLESREHLKNR